MREYQGLTADEMADALHVAPRSYKRFENGQDPVPPGVLEDQLKLVQQFEDTIDGMCGVVPFFPEDRDPTYTILDIP